MEIDASSEREAHLRGGISPIDDMGDERLRDALARGLHKDEPEAASLARADVILVCVPTPIDRAKAPDIRPILAAAGLIRESLRPGQLVMLQSTTFPGTTTGLFRAELERFGLRAGVDFDLAFAPERVNPGDPASASRQVPRLVGASDDPQPANDAAGDRGRV